MKINAEGLQLVKEFEGLYLKAYKCPAGVWTIGYGHTGTVDGKAICSGMTITEAKATELLKEDMAYFENAVANCKNLTFALNENQFSALVSFAFNCGEGSLATLVKNRDAKTVAEKMLLYNKANGVVLTGLVRRRKAEQALFLKSVTGTTATESEEYDMLTIRKGSTGKLVKIWQIICGTIIDGEFGNLTEHATIEFQKKYFPNEPSEWDGIVGKKTWAKGFESIN